METEEKKSAGKKIYIGTIVLLLLLNSVTLYLLFSEKGQRVTVTEQKSQLEQQFNEITATLDQKSAELDKFKGRTEELDKAIAEKQEEIAAQKKQIASLLAKGKLTAGELAKARQMIAQYETSIAEMTKKIDDLTVQNKDLTASNEKLNVDLTSEKQNTSQLTERNTMLSKKVEVGSLLRIAKVDVEAIKKKGNGKEVDVKRAKAAESLKISFETGENKVLDPGPVSLYVRIINPKGETILVEDQGSGVVKANETAEAVPYTKKADIDYDQTNKKVVVYWSKNIQTPGTYKVEVYQGAQVVGTGNVTLT